MQLQHQQGTSHADSLVESLQFDYSALQEKYAAAHQDLLNEQDIRKSAESHVKAMQKSLESQMAHNDISRDSTQNELESQRKACADLQHSLQAAKEQLNLEKERLKASEESRSLSEDTLESVNAHAASLQQVCISFVSLSSATRTAKLHFIFQDWIMYYADHIHCKSKFLAMPKRSLMVEVSGNWEEHCPIYCEAMGILRLFSLLTIRKSTD